MSDLIERSNDEVTVRLIAQLFIELYELAKCYKLPNSMESLVNFSQKNMERLLKTPEFQKSWGKVHLLDEMRFATEERTIRLVWTTLRIAKCINNQQRAKGKRLINWIEEATHLERLENAKIDSNGS
jgi:hypothetical protein